MVKVSAKRKTSSLRICEIKIGEILNFGPVELIPREYLPTEFEVIFLFEPISGDTQDFWGALLTIKTGVDEIPRTIKVSVEGNSVSKRGFGIVHRGRVKREHLSLIANEIWNLEGHAVEEFMKQYIFSEDERGFSWLNRDTASILEDGKTVSAKLSESDLKKIRKIVLGGNRYTKISPEHLREVAKIYIQARNDGQRTNAAVKEHFEKKWDREIPIKTVRGWITRARVYIPMPFEAGTDANPKNSSPTKAAQDARKPKTTKKIGEK